MKPIGTYRGTDTYELTRKEYIQERFYEDKTHYFVISDDGFVNRNGTWQIMVKNNQVVAAVKSDRSYIDTDIEQRAYYTSGASKLTSVVVESMKVGDKNWDAGSVTTITAADFDVDKYLTAAHSVDKYLEEMKNATYS